MNVSDWEIKKSMLIRQLDNGTLIKNGYEGLLYVKLTSKKTGETMRGTVCDHGFEKQAAKLFCRDMGYHAENGVWGSAPIYKYVAQLVQYKLINTSNCFTSCVGLNPYRILSSLFWIY
jgi:hypothetical protein